MAVDIALVLQSEHRRIRQLISRCSRSSRGFHDPVSELEAEVRRHLEIAQQEVYPTSRTLCDHWPQDTLDRIRAVLGDQSATLPQVIEAADALIEFESEVVIPSLQQEKDVLDRRRIGKVFRMRRDAAVRTTKKAHRKAPSQTELYEIARRAGVEQRSRMTQAELQKAITARTAKN